jgi:ribonucleotide reductase alpha subunit
VFGKILSKLKAIADFISFFHTLARVYDAVQKQKYAQAIFILAYHFDDELKENVKIIMETISSEIAQVMSEVNAVFRMIKDDMRSIYDTSQAYERVFRDFAKIFHVQAFEEIADAIHKYIDKNIENTIKYLDSVRDTLLNKMYYVVNPFGEVLTSIYLWERQEKSYQALYSYLSGRAISERLLRPAWDLKFMLFRVK